MCGTSPCAADASIGALFDMGTGSLSSNDKEPVPMSIDAAPEPFGLSTLSVSAQAGFAGFFIVFFNSPN